MRTAREMMDEALNICLVSAAYRPYPSGVSEHVHHLSLALRDRGHELTIVTTQYPGAEAAPEGIRVLRFGRALRVPLNRSFATLPVGWRLPLQMRRLLTGERFDVVHCHGMFFPEIAYWAIRYSRSVNVITALMAGFRIYRCGSRAYRWLFRHHNARIHGRVAISQRARDAVSPYVPGEYRIIPSGIDLHRFRPDLEPLPPRAAAERRILFVGRLDARKGLETLLPAMPAVLAALPHARLVVVGDGPCRPGAAATVQRLGISAAVHFVGQVSAADLPRYYSGADVFCSPALGGESLGIVLLEAMAAGVPVVASDIPGYRETVRHGLDGWLVPAGDAGAFAAAILAVLTDPAVAQRYREASLARARTYAWPQVAEQTEDYYRELLAGYGQPGRRGAPGVA